MQLLEAILIGTAVALVFIVAALSRTVANRMNAEPLEAQRPWDRYANLVGGMWMISLIAFAFLRNTGRFSYPSLAIVGIAIVTLIGLTALWVEYRRLQVMDEFIRRIRVEGHALSFGLSIVGVIALALATSVGIFQEVEFHKWGLMVMGAVTTANIIVFLKYR